jgi:hypothetical protein
MKALLLFCGVLLIGALSWFLIIRPACRTHFGGALRGLEPVGIAPLMEKPADFLKKDIRVEGTINRQCPHCACWFTIQDAGGRELKVEAGDLAEPVPYRPGRKAVVEGRLIRYGEGYEFVANALEFP